MDNEIVDELRNGAQSAPRAKAVKGMWYFDALKQSEDAKSIIDSMPTYDKVEIEMEPKNPQGFSAIVRKDKNEIVATTSRKYALVQHKNAFLPIIEGLDRIGEEYKVASGFTDTRAWISVLTHDTEDGVRVGFQAINSVDGSTALRYGFSTFQQTKWIELVGYRQVCSNGMVVRVPLENAEFVKLEERQRIEILLKKSLRIVHIGDDVQKKIEQVRLVVEAMALLKEPVARIIKASQDKRISKMEADKLLATYIGKRLRQELLGQFKKEEQTLWGLYNAITYVASHDRYVKDSTKNSLLNHSADLLMQEVQERA